MWGPTSSSRPRGRGAPPLPRPEGYWGALLVLGLITYPYLFLALRAAFLGVDPSVEEAARTLGHPRGGSSSG